MSCHTGTVIEPLPSQKKTKPSLYLVTLFFTETNKIFRTTFCHVCYYFQSLELFCWTAAKLSFYKKEEKKIKELYNFHMVSFSFSFMSSGLLCVVVFFSELYDHTVQYMQDLFFFMLARRKKMLHALDLISVDAFMIFHWRWFHISFFFSFFLVKSRSFFYNVRKTLIQSVWLCIHTNIQIHIYIL